jgi:hypothetical protein
MINYLNQFFGSIRVKVSPQVKYSFELDLQSLSGLYVHSCTHWLRPYPRIWAHTYCMYTRALLVSLDKRHLFVTPWVSPSPSLLATRHQCKVHIYVLRSFLTHIPQIPNRQISTNTALLFLKTVLKVFFIYFYYVQI